MAYPSARALLGKYGLRAKKSWGQNFLSDEAALEAIARLAVEREGERVVELGAGLGHLTARLVARGARVVAIERDRDMARVLRGELGDAVELVEADAARLDLAALALGLPPSPRPSPPAPAGGEGEGRPAGGEGENRIAVVGNLPYHLTSPILFSLLDQAAALSRAVLLVQREVAERLAAKPGTKAWGLLSVLLQREADVSIERIVPPGAFVPAPKVESAVVRIGFRPPPDPVIDPARFRRIVKAGFAQRRKTLANALRSARAGAPSGFPEALARAGIDGGRRGETLTVAEWAALERALGPAGE